MGYRKIPTIYTLTFDDYPDLEVRLKAMRLGRLRKFMSMSENTDDHIDEMISLLTESLVSWTLEDEEGVPIPIDASSFEDMELSFILEIFSAWTDQMTGVDEELGKGSSSGGTSLAQSLTMEAM